MLTPILHLPMTTLDAPFALTTTQPMENIDQSALNVAIYLDEAVLIDGFESRKTTSVQRANPMQKQSIFDHFLLVWELL